MGAFSIDRTSLLSDEAILAAINSKCEGMTPKMGRPSLLGSRQTQICT